MSGECLTGSLGERTGETPRFVVSVNDQNIGHVEKMSPYGVFGNYSLFSPILTKKCYFLIMNYNECPITRTLEIIGGKWKPIILHYLSEAPRRSSELGRLIPQASGKMLTQQLRELERDRIIRRKVYRQVPPKVEYILTPLGESLRPIMVAMCAWGAENLKGAPAKVDFAPFEPPQLGHAQARKGAYSNERL